MPRKVNVLFGQDPKQVLERIVKGAEEKTPKQKTITEKYVDSQKGTKPLIKRSTGPLLKK